MADVISVGAPTNSTEAAITLMETDEQETKNSSKTPQSSAMTLPPLIQTTPSRWTPSEPQPTASDPMDNMLKALMNCLNKKLNPITECLECLEKANADQQHTDWYNDPAYANYTQDQLLDYQGILATEACACLTEEDIQMLPLDDLRNEDHEGHLSNVVNETEYKEHCLILGIRPNIEGFWEVIRRKVA
jgi:hypothetical protein